MSLVITSLADLLPTGAARGHEMMKWKSTVL